MDAHPKQDDARRSREGGNRSRGADALFIGAGGLLGLACVLAVAQALEIVNFRYLREVRNEPLLAPVDVMSLVGDVVTLRDGRVIHIEVPMMSDLENALRSSNQQVDVEIGDGGAVELFVRREMFICGSNWVRGMINIELIPDEVPSLTRTRFAIGHFAQTAPATE